MLTSLLQVYTVYVSLDWFAHDCFDYIATSGDLACATPNLLITFSLKITSFPFLTLVNKKEHPGDYILKLLFYPSSQITF